jgi:hypothetical protein
VIIAADAAVTAALTAAAVSKRTLLKGIFKETLS